MRGSPERYAHVPTVRDGFNYLRCPCCDDPVRPEDMEVTPPGFGGDDVCHWCVEEAGED